MPLLRSTVGLSALEEPAFVRRISLSLSTMAVLTGAGLRLYRAVVLQYGPSDRWLWVGGTFVVGMAFLFLMATLHLGNHTVRSWLWRAPLFAFVESVTEMGVSLGLTLAGMERIGSLTATLEDWQGAAARILFVRMIGIPLFALVLALVSTIVRLALLPRKPVNTE
jgi:hypothetical protein